MKLAIAIIFALVCTTIADDVKACADTEHWNDGKACQPCTAPCKSCTAKDGKEWCLDCGANGGKYLADGKCSDCIKDCTACRGGAVGDCQTPAADMKVGPSSIVKCTGLTGCNYCSSENKCGKCAAGYQLKDDKCTPCTGNTCVDCTADVAKCTKCAYWNTLKDGACTACDAGCKDCPCTGCKSGYAFKDAKCTPCTDAFNCMECAADAGKCTKCAFGFLKDDKCNACSDTNCVTCTGADQCSTCRSGYALKDGKTCVKCPDDCETCDADAKCSKCKANFYINADKKCTGCGVGCDGCGTDGTCTKCVAGTWLATDKKSCLACGLSCQECADDKKCKTCVASAVIKDGVCKDASTCTFGQMIKDDQTCVAGTIANCAQGNGVAGTCPYCAPGFYTKDKTCANCPAGCKACAPDAKGYVKCSSFGQDGYSFTNDTNAKIDKSGYLGKDSTYTLNFDGSDNKCMPNTWSATYTLNPFKHKCIAYDSCTMIVGQSPFSCLIEGNAVKMTLSLFAVVIASLFTL